MWSSKFLVINYKKVKKNDKTGTLRQFVYIWLPLIET